ncbi:MAG: flavodoxin [Kiritimatiellia bacterium]
MNNLLKEGIVMIGLATSLLAAPPNVSRTAVIYYSWGGNTRFAAETIARKAKADLFRIEPQVAYSRDYATCCDEAKPECRGKKQRPIKPIEGLELSKYDTIFVGSPNWWGTLAPPVRTWITQNQAALKGKKVALFQTHGGGGMQRLGSDFAELVGPNSTILPPKAFYGSSIKRAVPDLEAFVNERINQK